MRCSFLPMSRRWDMRSSGHSSACSGILRASTLPELLVAMALSGLVLFFAYEGAGLLQRRLGVSRQDTGKWQLMRSHAVMERLVRQADSIRVSGPLILFYSDGIPSDTLAVSGGSVVYRKGGSGEVLFGSAAVAAERYASGPGELVKALDISLLVAGGDTLRLHYLAGASGYIEALYRSNTGQNGI